MGSARRDSERSTSCCMGSLGVLLDLVIFSSSTASSVSCTSSQCKGCLKPSHVKSNSTHGCNRTVVREDERTIWARKELLSLEIGSLSKLRPILNLGHKDEVVGQEITPPTSAG